ncbi:MAG: hypothetical protein P4N60_14885 [Verrucomicrobiae bacterium]|nr:hypothetical protein [Verrucomicrobiae bacterium]
MKVRPGPAGYLTRKVSAAIASPANKTARDEAFKRWLELLKKI